MKIKRKDSRSHNCLLKLKSDQKWLEFKLIKQQTGIDNLKGLVQTLSNELKETKLEMKSKTELLENVLNNVVLHLTSASQVISALKVTEYTKSKTSVMTLNENDDVKRWLKKL